MPTDPVLSLLMSASASMLTPVAATAATGSGFADIVAALTQESGADGAAAAGLAENASPSGQAAGAEALLAQAAPDARLAKQQCGTLASGAFHPEMAAALVRARQPLPQGAQAPVDDAAPVVPAPEGLAALLQRSQVETPEVALAEGADDPLSDESDSQADAGSALAVAALPVPETPAPALPVHAVAAPIAAQVVLEAMPALPGAVAGARAPASPSAPPGASASADSGPDGVAEGETDVFVLNDLPDAPAPHRERAAPVQGQQAAGGQEQAVALQADSDMQASPAGPDASGATERSQPAEAKADTTSSGTPPRPASENTNVAQSVAPAPAPAATAAERLRMHPVTVVHAETPAQMTEAVGAHIVRQHREGRTEFTLRMDPPELGRIDVRMDVGTDGAVRAVIAADSPQTLELLQRDARGLERLFADAGLKTDSGSLTFTDRQSGGFAQTGSGQQGTADGSSRDGQRSLPQWVELANEDTGQTGNAAVARSTRRLDVVA